MNTNKDIIVIYHADCVDGFTAAWCAWTSFGNRAEYIPARYGDAPPDVSGKDVYVLDFSYPRDVLSAMSAKARSIYILDHHKSARENLEGLDFCTFDMERSGAGLAWDYFFPSRRRPALVDYVEDRDLWRFALPFSREISAYIATVDRTFEAWTQLDIDCSTSIATVIEKGRVALRVVDQYVERQLARARAVNIAGHEVPCINTTFAVSELVGELAQEAPFAAGWFQREDGKFVVSLRSRGDGGIDVSEIARQFGGGGHRNAAGFTVDVLPWEVQS